MKKRFNIAIIGAGWFGCHIAKELLEDGHNIFIYEREKNILEGASGNSQNRLHLGYHYPRSYLTREQSKRGFYDFKKYYPSLSSKVKKNFYAISNHKESLIDFQTFLQILKSTKLHYKIINPSKYNINNIEGLISCKEESINIKKSKIFFNKILNGKIKFNYDLNKIIKNNNKFIIDDKKYDFIINSTWQQLEPSKKWNLTYELCISLLYKSNQKNSYALTIMDGPFFTLYPWSQKEFNLYSVQYSRYKVANNFKKIKNTMNKLNKQKINLIKQKIENEFIKYMPDFKKNYKFIKYIKAFRSIISTKKDSRDYKIEYKNGVFNILSGKIDHIFFASRDIKKCLKKFL